MAARRLLPRFLTVKEQKLSERENGVRNATLWRTLLGVEKTVVEAIDLDDETGLMIASVRPTGDLILLEPISTEVRMGEEPIEEPVEGGPATDAEVVDAFRTYLAERAAKGVVVAKAVTDVSFSDRVVRVTFDPAAAGMDQATFDEANLWNNPYDSSETASRWAPGRPPRSSG